MEKDIAIIGDGVQGTGIALALAKTLDMEDVHERLVVIGDQWYLKNWERFTKAQGMTYLVSPNDRQVWSAVESYSDVFPEPSVKDFCNNAETLIKKYKIDVCHKLGRASNLEMNIWVNHPFSFEVSSLQDQIYSKILILALGYGSLAWPSELLELTQRFPDKIMHTHNISENMDWSNKNVLIYGMGRSSLTLRQHIFNLGGMPSVATRWLPKRSKIYYPDFTEPENVQNFRNKSLQDRLRILEDFYTNRPSLLPPDQEISPPAGIYLQHEILGVNTEDEKIQVLFHDHLDGSQKMGEFDVLILATGYRDTPIEPSLIPQETPFLEFGNGIYPAMDEYLQINGIPGFFGLGHLSLLRQGVAARDIPAIPSHVQAIMQSEALLKVINQ